MKNLVRNDSYIKSLLKKVDDQVLVTEDLYILIPDRYYEKGLAIREDKESVFGMFSICSGGYYTFHSICAMIETEPSRIVETTIDGVGYSRMEYDAGDAIVSRIDLINNPAIIFIQFNEFLFGGKPPIGIGYVDLLRSFDKMTKYSGLSSIKAVAVIEVMIMAISKSMEDSSIPYKDTDMVDDPNFRPMDDVGGVVQGVLNRMAGAGFNQGLVESLMEEKPVSRKLERTILK